MRITLKELKNILNFIPAWRCPSTNGIDGCVWAIHSILQEPFEEIRITASPLMLCQIAEKILEDNKIYYQHIKTAYFKWGQQKISRDV